MVLFVIPYCSKDRINARKGTVIETTSCCSKSIVYAKIFSAVGINSLQYSRQILIISGQLASAALLAATRKH